MKFVNFFLFMSVLLSVYVRAEYRDVNLQKSQIPFIKNIGQLDYDIAFYAQTFGSTVFITNDGKIKYSLDSYDNINNSKNFNRLILQEEFIGGKRNKIQGLNKTSTKVNYFLESKQSNWNKNIPVFNTVSLGNVYDNIEIMIRAHQNNVEKLFIIQPYADPNDIQIKILGINDLSIDNDGELILSSENGTISFTKPLAYQEEAGNKKYVDVKYKINQNTYSFETGKYDHNKTLIIDPLIASTFVGGSATDGSYYTGDDLEIDSNGNIFITGTTTSLDFPAQPGAYNQNNMGGSDIYVLKLSADLSTLLACTYIGGSNNDEARDLIIDQSGNVYVTGITESVNFPKTNSSFDTSYNGGSSSPYGSGDAFICKLDNNLSQLLASTFIGGSGHDNSSSIALDYNNNVFISGTTSSTNFPFTLSAYDTTHQPGGNFQDDVFVAKLDNNLSTLLAGTYLGGSADDFTEALTVDNSGNVYVSGWIASTNFPFTTGCYDSLYGGYYYDAFVSKFSNNLSSLTASTFLGGSSWEFVYGMCLDDSNNVYITGHTASLNFPVSTNTAYDTSYSGSLGANYGDDVFVTKFNSDLSILKASTYLGGSQWENGWSIQVRNNKVYVSGTTSSSNFPTSDNAFNRTYLGGNKYNGDIFISSLDQNLTTLSASTYLGSNGNESIGSIGIGTNGNVYVSGSTGSSNFPTISSAYDTSFNGGTSDVFVSILDSMLAADPTYIKNEIQPETFKLYTNYPNPFNPTTTIKYDLPFKSYVSLYVYNALGQEIKVLVNKVQSAGNKSVSWDGKDNHGKTVSSGVYLYRIQIGQPYNISQFRKMIFIK